MSAEKGMMYWFGLIALLLLALVAWRVDQALGVGAWVLVLFVLVVGVVENWGAVKRFYHGRDLPDIDAWLVLVRAERENAFVYLMNRLACPFMIGMTTSRWIEELERLREEAVRGERP